MMSQRGIQLKKVQEEGFKLFEKKNQDYGDAFATYGTVGILVRMGDKIHRLQSITSKGINLVEDEKLMTKKHMKGARVKVSNLKHLISLGKLESEKFLLDDKLSSISSDKSSVLSSLVVEQKYSDGSFCKDTSKNRETLVRISCCESDLDVSSKNSYKLKYVKEESEGSCNYIAGVCSPALCTYNTMDTFHAHEETKQSSLSSILQRALYKNCLIRGVDWWKYEFW